MHQFHIPVMGIAYSLETPVKVGHFGIDSVMSIMDHRLTETLREYHSKLHNWYFQTIPDKHEEDGRAKRITAYLDMVNAIVQDNLSKLKNSLFNNASQINKYFEMLPASSPLKQAYDQMLELDGPERLKKQQYLRGQIKAGSADVNIMTKLDKTNYDQKGNPLPIEYNDAHAALRGFANSSLESNVVFSAGINTRLYSYLTNFPDFLPDGTGYRKKGIIVKVSDYKSALIQGKFLAKKGLWVSEFRVESGLNCGGHAFATDGHLLGPIMQEFKDRRQELFDMLYKAFAQGMESNNLRPPTQNGLPLRISVQGGVGTSEEQEFLIEQYGVDSVGWGSPFLLVPEAVTIDQSTKRLVAEAKEEDLHLSNISPLGVPFNTVKNTTEEQARQNRILKNVPGSPCNKKYLVSNTEFTDTPVCTASRTYQSRKLKELENKHYENEQEREEAYEAILTKTCICNGLTNSALLEKGMPVSLKGSGVSICPGPNMAYFDKVVSLQTMVQHIYGSTNLVNAESRPNLFLKELKQYIEYFNDAVTKMEKHSSEKSAKYLQTFKDNLEAGIAYYRTLFEEAGKQASFSGEAMAEWLATLREVKA